MKKFFFSLVFLITAYGNHLFAQCGTTLFVTSNSYGVSIVSQSCNSTQLQFNWNCKRYSCPNNSLCSATSSATIKLRYNPTAFSLTGSSLTTITTSNFTAYNYNVTQSGYYWLEDVTDVTTTTQDCCGSTVNWVNSYSNGSSGAIYITIQTAASATFKVDGNTVNPSTYTQVYGCSTSDVQMNNISWSGATSGYQWQVEVIRTSDGRDVSTTWNSSTPGSTYDLRSFILSNFTTLPGQYTVKLWVKNVCNTGGTAYVGKIQINTVPVACIQLANNSSTGCNPAYYVNLGPDIAHPTSTCQNSPKITASCSNGEWVGGYWNLLVFEFDASNNFVKFPVSTGNQSLSNLSDISCLNLNDWSSPLGYFYSNPSGYKYAVLFTVGNDCGSSSASGYFQDNTGGCKTDGEDDATYISDPFEQAAKAFSVYPNPVENELNVMWQYNTGIYPSVKLYSIDGRQINAPVQSTGLGELKLDVSGLEKGIYSLELNDGIKRVKKVVIE